MRSNSTFGAYVILFLAATVVVALTHIVLGLVTASWWSSPLANWGANPVLIALFLVGPVLGALVVASITRRWDWYPAALLGALVLALALKLVDDGLGLAASRGTANGGIALAARYGLLTAAGTVAPIILLAGRRRARRTRL